MCEGASPAFMASSAFERAPVPFWEGASVLLTGATGFVGKAVLARLLHGDVGRPREIFVLVRQRKGQGADERVQELLESPIFDAVRAAGGGDGGLQSLISSGAVVAVPGDLASEGLGMSPEMRARVVASCTVVVNCAASIDFQLSLLAGRNINVLGPLRVLALAQECHSRPGGTGLRAFVHVSTAYVNADKPGRVEERLHQPPVDPDTFMDMTEDYLSQHAEELTAGFPNSYTFTKRLGEQALQRHARGTGGGRFPLVIVRPSIIGCSWRSPKCGWVDAVMSASAFVLMVGLGVARKLRGVNGLITDIVPLDTVVDAILGAAACLPHLHAEEGSVPVVHACTSSIRPLQNTIFSDIVSNYFAEYPSSSKQVRSCKFQFADPAGSEFQKEIATLRMQSALLKGLFFTRRLGEKVATMVDKITRTDDAFCFFMSNEFIFETHNVSRMPGILAKCGEPVQAYGGLQLTELDWSHYVGVFCYGVRTFLLREEDAFCPTMEQSKAMRRPSDLLAIIAMIAHRSSSFKKDGRRPSRGAALKNATASALTGLRKKLPRSSSPRRPPLQATSGKAVPEASASAQGDDDDDIVTI